MTLSSYFKKRITKSTVNKAHPILHTLIQDESGEWLPSEVSELQEDGGQGGGDQEAGGEARGLEHGEGLEEGGGEAAEDQAAEAGQQQRRLRGRGVSLQRLWLG